MPLKQSVLEQFMTRHPHFSGVVQVRRDGELVFGEGYGCANRADHLPNTLNTRFGIASGTKVLTGVAICQLIEQGKLTFATRLQDVVDAEFPQFDPAITVRHLITHTSGAPDYFDEEKYHAADDFGALWHDHPVYMMRTPGDYLPLFQREPMKLKPGERFAYSNGGFVLLGLIIEAVTGQSYIDYVTQCVIQPAGMTDSGFFMTDRLPANTALGYIDHADGTWRTNVFELPIIGCADGGLFATAPDLSRFWDALFEHRLMGAAMLEQFLHPHVPFRAGTDDMRHYGYGIWMMHVDGTTYRYYGVGSDPGISFVSTRFAQQNLDVTVIGNTADGAWPVFEGIMALS